MTACLRAAVIVALVTAAAHAQTNPGVSPLPGIEIPAEARAELEAASRDLGAAIAAALTPDGPDGLPADLRRRLPDVEVFSKAVEWALQLDGFHDAKHVDVARRLLAEGRSRLDALEAGTTPWTKATGLVVRGFRSRIDGSVQPYGLVVPEDLPATGGRMDVWLHGRNDKLSELAFLADRTARPGEFAPPKTLVLQPYGRFCNAYKFAGETDVLEAVDDAIREYGISPDHVALRGFSMGGAGAWHLGAHHATRWAVIAPGAGFVETANYAKVFAPGKPEPPQWEQVLWRLYDVPGYAVNLTNRPVVAYSGETDPQKKAADIMVEAVAAVGGEMPHLVGPGTGHRYHPETKKELAARVDAAAEAGRPTDPERVRFATFTLRYDRLDWVRVTGLAAHWRQATVDASHTGPAAIAVKTSGVTGLAVAPPAAWNPGTPWRVTIDGTTLEHPAGGGELAFHLDAKGRWAVGGIPDGDGRKRHGLQGPIDDAFMDAFIFVRPTGRSPHAAVDAWVRAELERAIATWRVNFRGDPRVMDDTAVTPELMREAHVVLWGDPSSNRLLARMLPRLPIGWDDRSLTVAGVSHDAATHAPVIIHPNPLAPDRYVVLNSTYTFRQGSSNTNALQTPKLPDWAVISLDTPPSLTAPGLVKAAGFFDERWRFSEPVPEGRRIYGADHVTGEVVAFTEDGTKVWSFPNRNSHDVQVLANGNVLINPGVVQEVTPDGTVVWEVGKPVVMQAESCQRLPDGTTMIADNGMHAILDVTPDKQVAWRYDVPGKPSMRQVRRLANGNTLICASSQHAVIEVTPAKEIVWRYELPFPYLAQRLESGNTLISSGAGAGKKGYYLVEVDPAGKTVWKYGGDDAAADEQLDWPSGFVRMPDGTIYVSECRSARIRVISPDRRSFRFITSPAMKHAATIAVVDAAP